ncbi:MAG TPA: ferrous iron transport protein A [Methermicoccus shengliensis]|uniref:Ferrous iron transport protein A n=2 Tax=Methermicoccus shengliensis TaxID=660064 RepID=A0A832RS90_9EURY|nr:ferrous iron transport protein A [Methermicoccus shengliensis]
MGRRRGHCRGAIALCDGRAGSECVVVDIEGDEAIRRRLYEMGFTPSSVVRVIASLGEGSVLVEVRGSRVGLSGSIATSVRVRSVAE